MAILMPGPKRRGLMFPGIDPGVMVLRALSGM
jgi:hypothetical protein